MPVGQVFSEPGFFPSAFAERNNLAGDAQLIFSSIHAIHYESRECQARALAQAAWNVGVERKNVMRSSQSAAGVKDLVRSASIPLLVNPSACDTLSHQLRVITFYQINPWKGISLTPIQVISLGFVCRIMDKLYSLWSRISEFLVSCRGH